MRKTTTTLFLALSALLAGCNLPKRDDGGGDGKAAVGASGLGGSYTIAKGQNPGGKGGYAGTVNVVPNGSVYDLHWIIGGKAAYDGVAIASGHILGVGWGIGGTYGVVVYKVSGGKLDGTWAASGSGKAGLEQLQGPAGLVGTFKVTKGTTPTGSSYTGNVVITKTAIDLYDVKWTLSNGSYRGTGIQEGDVFVVGYGSGGQGAGAVSYRVAGSTWTGRWASPGDVSFGFEDLKKN
jgi:hypothetical protein